MVPAALGAFGKQAAGAARGGLIGGIPGAVIGGILSKKKGNPTPPTTGPSPSYGG